MDRVELDEWIYSSLTEHPSQYVQHAGGVWSVWNVPQEHEWVHDDVTSVMAQAEETGRNPLDHLSVAVCNDLEAFAVMQSWKVWELCHGLVVALNSMNLVTAAGTARSAMEATCTLVVASFRANQAFQPTRDARARLNAVTELAAFTEKLIWGGRANLTNVEATNVLSFRDKIVKKTTDQDTKSNLVKTYEILCDMVHPSALGHQLYWSPEVDSPQGGQWLVPLRFGEPNKVAMSTIWLIAWALGWSVSWSKRAADDLIERAEEARAIIGA